MLRFVSVLAAALLLGRPAHAQDAASGVDQVFAWATPATPGCAVAVSRNGRLLVDRAYGLAEMEHAAAFTTSTISEPGSVAKQFTAAAVLLLAEDGRLSLSDDVRLHIPELPDYGRTITVDHLLSHTSGIRDWGPLVALAGAPRRWTVYGNSDALNVILRQRALNFEPGEEFSYSNSGYALLVEIVERASGMSFVDFTRARLFQPLGMSATAWRTDFRDLVEDRAQAYVRDGETWKLAMPLENYYGGGGLLSTTRDLLIWNDALTSGRLGSFVSQKLEERARLNNGRQIAYARGLIVDQYRGLKEVWHSGGAAGYHAWLARYPEQGLSIALLCNSDAVSTRTLAHSVIDQFLPAAPADIAGAGATPADPALAGAATPDVSSRAGLYLDERTGEPLRLIVRDGRLQIPGGDPLVAASENRFRNVRGDLFFRSQDEFELRFLSDDRFELTSMEGETIRYRRAEPYEPLAADLEDYPGRYRSEEIGATYEITTGPRSVVVRRMGSSGDGTELRAIARDTFQSGLTTVRFRRDDGGDVVAFELGNPVLRKLDIPRQSASTEREAVPIGGE